MYYYSYHTGMIAVNSAVCLLFQMQKAGHLDAAPSLQCAESNQQSSSSLQPSTPHGHKRRSKYVAVYRCTYVGCVAGPSKHSSKLLDFYSQISKLST